MKGFIKPLIAPLAIVLLAVLAFVIIGEPKQKAIKVPIQLSQRSVNIDSVKQHYKAIIDSLNQRKPIIQTKIKYLREQADTVYLGNDTTCIEIIRRKDNLISALDSLSLDLEKEAQMYSALYDSTETQRKIDLSTFRIKLDSCSNEIEKLKQKQKKATLIGNIKTAIGLLIGICL